LRHHKPPPMRSSFRTVLVSDHVRASLFAVACCAAFPPAALAESAPIAGCVRGPDGSPVISARVTVASLAHAATTTDARGCFTLDAATRFATVRVDASGFEPFVHAGVTAGSHLTIALASAATSLLTIGRVDVDARSGVSTTSAPSVTLDMRRASLAGFATVADVLSQELSLTAIRPAGGGPNAPRVFALRGPDPTETLVDIDGHEINNGNTGDFDLSLLTPEDLQSVEIVYGIAPSSLVGPNTIGGAINVRTLEPTQKAHGMIRTSFGSYGLFDSSVQSTGTSGRFGYALSLHRRATDGEIHRRRIAFPGDVSGQVATALVGSDASTSTALAKIRYATSGSSSAGFVELSVRDQSLLRDQSAALTELRTDGTFKDTAGSFVASHNAAYGLDVRLPVGARDGFGNAPASLTARHLTSVANQSVFGPGADSSSAYFFNNRDVIADDTLEFDRVGATTSFALKAVLRTERLTEPVSVLATAGAGAQTVARRLSTALAMPLAALPAPSSLAQTQRSFVARYAFEALPHVHATVASYYSNFSTFGTSLDPRFGIVWTPTSRTALRTSLGTTFQSPTLNDLYVPSPLPSAGDGLVRIGNAHLKADHATEYDLGAEQLIGGGKAVARLGLDLYRTNMRTPLQSFVPASGKGYTYPANLGGAVYQGFELRAVRDIAPGTQLRLGYSVGNAYATTVPPEIAHGSIVAGKQFLGVPLQRGNFAIQRDGQSGLSFRVGGAYEGRNNELNAPQFVVLDASIGYAVSGYRLDLAGQNLTNVYASGFTRTNGGVPYIGASGPIPLDAYALPARNVRLSVSRRF